MLYKYILNGQVFLADTNKKLTRNLQNSTEMSIFAEDNYCVKLMFNPRYPLCGI